MAVAVAILLPVLIGFAGLGVEVGLWFWIQRQNQSAADAAALSAGLEYAAQIQRGVATDSSAATAAATTAANCNWFSTGSSSSNLVCPLPSSASNTITLYPCYGFAVGGSCDTSNPSGMTPNAVQAVLTQPLNTMFANVVTALWGPNVSTVNVTTSAIAAFPQASSVCLLALDPIAANAVSVVNGTLSNPNCWAASNSTSASALSCNNCTMTGPTTAVGGDAVSNGGQLNGSPNRTYASATADPYATTLTHAFLTAGMAAATPCNAPTFDAQFNPCVNSGDLPFNGNGTIYLSPGTYWMVDGSLILNGNIRLTCQGCSPGGLGVTIIFTTIRGSAGTIGTLSETGNVTTILNAPSTGPYAGLLMVQDPVPGVTPIPGSPIGSPSATLSGLLYFPRTSLSFVGNVQTDPSNCLVAVANSFSLTGTIGLNDSGCLAAGLTTVPTILSVFLAV